MKPMAEKVWGGGYSFTPFQVRTTVKEFVFSRRSLKETSGSLTGSSVSALWTPNIQETLINGVRQGRKQSDPRGASAICRLKMGGSVIGVFKALALPAFAHLLKTSKYSELKQSDLLKERRRVKQDSTRGALVGWIPNTMDDFELPQG